MITPATRLERLAQTTKSAALPLLGAGVRTAGQWAPRLKTLGRAVFSLKKGGVWGMAQREARSRGHRGLAKGFGTMRKASLPLMGYGMAGEVGNMTGFYNLPGSRIAGFAGMPGWSGAFMAPNVIRAGRMATGRHTDAIKADAQTGAEQAGVDFLGMLHNNPQSILDPASYGQHMDAHGLPMSGAPAQFAQPYQPHSWMQRTTNLFNDSDALISEQIHRHTSDALNKAGSIGGVVMKGLTGLGVATGAYGIGNAALSKKPYDERRVQEEAYAAAQQGIDQKLQGLPAWQRRLISMDPSLATFAIGQHAPGVVSKFKEQYEMPNYQPGMLASMHQAWSNKGRPSYYTTDNTGRRNYVARRDPPVLNSAQTA